MTAVEQLAATLREAVEREDYAEADRLLTRYIDALRYLPMEALRESLEFLERVRRIVLNGRASSAARLASLPRLLKLPRPPRQSWSVNG